MLQSRSVCVENPRDGKGGLSRPSLADTWLPIRDSPTRTRSDQPLHFASRNGHLERVRLLLDEGASVDAKDEHKCTPLHWASEGRLEVISLLLNKGARVDAEDERKRTRSRRVWGRPPRGRPPPHRQGRPGGRGDPASAPRSTGALLRPPRGRPPPRRQGRPGGRGDRGQVPPRSTSRLRGPPRSRPLPRRQGRSGWTRRAIKYTPLLNASTNGHLEVVRLLVDKGARMDAEDDYWWTPLHKASESGHLDVIRLLVDAGADLHARANMARRRVMPQQP